MRRKRILVFRPDNIGDVVLFSGALKHIRTLFPDAHLTLAVQSHIINLVELCPYVDSCVSCDDLNWWETISSFDIPFVNRFDRMIRGANRTWNSIFRTFDTVIYPVKSPDKRHLKIIKDLKVKKVIGITGCMINRSVNGCSAGLHPAELFTDKFDVTVFDPWRHELSTTFDFLRQIGCRITSVTDIQPEFWLSMGEVDHLANIQNQVLPIVGLFPGATSELRQWCPNNFGDFAKLMGKNYQYVIFGGQADKKLASLVERSIRATVKNANIVNLVGETTLRELVKSIISCDLFVGMETSGLHMAIAAGIPTVGIVGGGHYGRFVPWGDKEKNIFLSKELGCYHCNWYCKNERVECIQDVMPLEVATAAKKLLKININ
jgi:ADP-heptose:LPS heptosyltransferase